MIKALIIDIDGVIVGEKIGYNSPYPHPDVIKRLAAIRNSGVPVILCTAKPHYSILPIIKSAGLENPHITYAGGVIIDPIKNKIIENHPLPKSTSEEIITTSIANNFYTEVYGLDQYFVLRNQVNDLTRVHTHILQQEPILLDSFEGLAQKTDIYKIMPVVPDETGIPKVEAALAPYKDLLEITWSLHPIAMPHQFCGIAEKGISKRQAATTVLSYLNIDQTTVLGVGDSTSDWKFMELCGFVATLENGQQPLKALVEERGSAGFMGGHVDTNGFLAIVDHFTIPSPPPPKTR